MKKLLVLLLQTALFLAVSNPIANAQGLRLDQVWNLNPGDRPYLNTGTTERGLAYNLVTGHLIIVSRTSGTRIDVLDAATGGDIAAMDTTGISGGTFILSKVGVADDGAIYAGNFGTIGSATPTFNVYRWQDEISPPTVAYAADPGAGNIQQWGTTFAVRGAGTNTQILISSSTGTIAALLTTTDGTNFSSTVLAADVLPGQMGIGLAFGTNDTFWAKSVDGNLLHLSFNAVAGTATTLQNYSITNFPGSVAPIGVLVASNLLVGINVTTPDAVNLYSISNLLAPPVLLSSTNTPTDIGNTLSMGAVAFGGGLIFTLDSNNGIVAYTLTPSSDPVPPSVVLHPTAKTVFAGNNVTFAAAAAGTAPLRYQWQTNSVPIPNATNAVLTITNAQSGNEAIYDVVITNVAGSVTTFGAQLTVLPPGVLTPIWSLAPGSRAYLTSTSNNQRGMAYNPVTGHLILVNMAGGLTLNVLDAATGTNIGTLNTNGISGGTFALLMVGVADDGVIYGANFGSLSGSVIPTIYRWANESAVPTIAFKDDPTHGIQSRQWGNALDVRGAGTNTQILFPSAQQYVAIMTTTNGTDFSSVLLSGIPNATVLQGAAFGAGNTFWGKAATLNLYHFAFDLTNGTATELENFDGSLFDNTVNPIGVDAAHNLLAGVSIATPDTIKLYDLSNVSPGNPPVLLQTVKAPTDNANTLFRGALDFGDEKLFALDTNNGISAFALPFLRIVPAGANVVISWQSSLAGFNLETTTDVASGVWTPVNGATVVSGRYTITQSAATNHFYRLRK